MGNNGLIAWVSGSKEYATYVELDDDGTEFRELKSSPILKRLYFLEIYEKPDQTGK